MQRLRLHCSAQLLSDSSACMRSEPPRRWTSDEQESWSALIFAPTRASSIPPLLSDPSGTIALSSSLSNCARRTSFLFRTLSTNMGHSQGSPKLCTFLLNSGFRIPGVGLGTWQAEAGDVGGAVKTALKAGYRHIDCGAIYGNEAEVRGLFLDVSDCT